jgi:hypothetical protein
MNMLSKSYSHRCRTAHAVGWSRVTRWIVSVMCGLLLALVSAAAAHASSAIARDAADCTAASCDAVAAESTHAASVAVLTQLPMRGSGHHCPLDSDDVWTDLDDDNDDDVGQNGDASQLAQLSVEEALGQGHSPAPAGSLMSDERTPATQFLIDSVRRM